MVPITLFIELFSQCHTIQGSRKKRHSCHSRYGIVSVAFPDTSFCVKKALPSRAHLPGENMKIIARLAISLGILVSLTGCAGSNAAIHNPAAGFSFIHRDSDLHYAWNAKQTEQGVSVDGLIKNVEYPRIEGLEIKVLLLDKAKKVISQATGFTVPYSIMTDDTTNFGVLLRKAKLSEGDLLQFLASYNAVAGQSSFSWISSFTVNAITGEVVGRHETHDDQW
jgi:hypothetical protein